MILIQSYNRVAAAPMATAPTIPIPVICSAPLVSVVGCCEVVGDEVGVGAVVSAAIATTKRAEIIKVRSEIIV